MVSSVAILHHAESLGVLASLIGCGLRHGLGTFAITFVLQCLVRMGHSHFILRHQCVELLGHDSSVIERVAGDIWLLHRLEIIRRVQLTQIDRLIAATVLGHPTGDCQAFAE